jgi:hypothetical protein
MTPKCLTTLLAFINWSQCSLLQAPRETRVGLDTFCPGTGSSLTEAGLPKFYVAANELYNKHLRPPVWSAVKIRHC